ncbi:MAG: TolC family protein [Hyphomicrobiales bacterium]
MTLKKPFLLCVLVLSSYFSLYAQETDFSNVKLEQDTSTLRITLDDAIDLALARNWDVLYSKKETESSKAQYQMALGGLLPNLSLAGTYNNFVLRARKIQGANTTANPSPYTRTVSDGSIYNFDGQLNLSQVIFNLSTFVGVKYAKGGVELSRLGEKVQEQETILAVKMAYYDILLAKDLLQVSEESYSYSKANLDNVAKFYKQGVSSEYDLLQAEVQLANSEPGLIQARNNLELAYIGLKTLLALPARRKLQIESGFSRYMSFKPFLDSLPEFDIKKNYGYQSLELQRKLAKQNVAIAKSSFWPVLSLVGTWDATGNNNHLRLNDYFWTDKIELGVSLSFNLFSGFQNKAQVKMARIAKDEVDIQLGQLQNNLEQQSTEYTLNMDEAYNRIEAQQKGLETARKALNIAFSRYLNGVGTQLEIINNQSLFTEARSNFSQAIYDFLVARANYQALMNIR